MLKLGEYHTLRIKKRTDYGLYLDGGDEGNILLPNRYVTKDMRIGDEIECLSISIRTNVPSPPQSAR